MGKLADYWKENPGTELLMTLMHYRRNAAAYSAFVYTKGLEDEFDEFFDEWLVQNGERFKIQPTET